MINRIGSSMIYFDPIEERIKDKRFWIIEFINTNSSTKSFVISATRGLYDPDNDDICKNKRISYIDLKKSKYVKLSDTNSKFTNDELKEFVDIIESYNDKVLDLCKSETSLCWSYKKIEKLPDYSTLPTE